MAGWKEVIFKGITVSDLGMIGVAQGDILVAGSTPFTFAVLTKGTSGDVLTVGATTVSWVTPDYAPAVGTGQGSILVAGADPYTYAELAKGTSGHVLTAGATTISWTAAGAGDFKADGSVPMTASLNFANNTAKDMKLHTTVPGVPADGHIYFDSASDKVKVYVA